MSTLLGVEGADVENDELPDQIELDSAQVKKELKRLDAMRGAMDKYRKPYEPDYEAVADYVDPDMYHRSGKQHSNGNQSRSKIVNPTPTAALKVLQAGMFSGTANPTRSWFRIQHPDAELNNNHAVKEWLAEVHDRMQNVMLRSNLYKALPKLFSQLGLFGIGSLFVVDDVDDVIRFHNRMVGTFYVANDERGIVGTYMEEQVMSVRQVVSTFGYKQCSDRVRTEYDRDNMETEVKVNFVVERNPEYDPDKLEAKYKRYRTTYWEKGASNAGGLLSVSGVDMFPVIVPRWDNNGNDPYGHGLGKAALGDFKSMSLAEKQGQLARELNVKPTWIVHTSLANQPKLFIPGSYIISDAKDGAVPAHKATIDESGTRLYIQALEDRIKETFHVPLFLMAANDDRSNITATEVQARQQERMMALGPVLQNLNDEAFDVLIDLVFDAMERRGLIPEAPPELQGVKLSIEYISILAQAQKAADVTSLDRFRDSVFLLANGNPEDSVLDLLPKDAMARRYHELLGQHPDVIKAQDEVDEERDARNAQIQQQQELEQAQSMAQTAKTLGDTSLDDTNALSAVLGGGNL